MAKVFIEYSSGIVEEVISKGVVASVLKLVRGDSVS